VPWNDWQFWVVTAVTLVIGVRTARALWPRSASRGQRTSVQLTIGREKVSQR
jgi:hypothetical protein